MNWPFRKKTINPYVANPSSCYIGPSIAHLLPGTAPASYPVSIEDCYDTRKGMTYIYINDQHREMVWGDLCTKGPANK